MDPEFERELAGIRARFQGIIKGMTNREVKDVLLYASEPYIQTARLKAPRSRRTHYRYNTPKLVGRIRAPNGRGVRVATYKPGNLARSVKALSLRRLKRSLHIGPKIAKNGKGNFASNTKVDGYYAGFMEFGTRKQQARGFLKESFRASKPAVLKRLKYGLEQMVKKQIKRQGFASR